MRHGSLFSGIGGFDLAAEWMGWENVFHCEWNPFGQKILKHYWPDAISYTDITKTDFTIHRGKIDIITGGFPCQPYSQAGLRNGKEDERHLWPEMLRAIREIQPCWIVGENVSGIINWSDGLVFDEVQTEMEAEGYEVWTYVLPACAVNAPHKRERVWFIAYSSGKHLNIPIQQRRQDQTENVNAERVFSKGFTSNAANVGLQRSKQAESRGRESQREFGRFNRKPSWAGWPSQSPVCVRNDGFLSGLDTTAISFSKWRNESIAAAGNAIVPQVALEIFKTIDQYEKL